jgi:hypothetical protein
MVKSRGMKWVGHVGRMGGGGLGHVLMIGKKARRKKTTRKTKM